MAERDWWDTTDDFAGGTLDDDPEYAPTRERAAMRALGTAVALCCLVLLAVWLVLAVVLAFWPVTP